MDSMNLSQQELPSTRPYLLRALHEWCTDHGFSPYIAVQVDASVQVPQEYVKNGEIVLNVSFDATNGLRLGNDYIEFKARFGGVAREIIIPVGHVIAIYARENGQGMAFPPPAVSEVLPAEAADAERAPLRAVPSDEGAVSDEAGEPPPDGPTSGGGGRSHLKRVK